MFITFSRAHLATARLAIFGPLSDGLWFLLGIFLRLLTLAILIAVWPAMLAPGHEVGGYSLSTALTYTLVGAVFADQLNLRTPIGRSLRSGAIASRFTWPMPIVTQHLAELAGTWALPLLIASVPLVIVAPRLGVNPLPASPSAGALFAISLSLAIAIGVAVDVAFALLTVRVELGFGPLSAARATINSICSGAWIPLGVLPFHLGAIFQWLPFASAASAPLRIYTATGDPIVLLSVQLFWAAVLTLAVWTLWKRTRERLVMHGG